MYTFKEKTNELLNPKWAEEHDLVEQHKKAIETIGNRIDAGTVLRFVEFYNDEEMVGWGLIGDDVGVVELLDVATTPGRFDNGIPELVKFLGREYIQKWVREEDPRLYKIGFTHAEVNYAAIAKQRLAAIAFDEFGIAPPEGPLDLSGIDPQSPFAVIMRLGAHMSRFVVGESEYYMAVIPPNEKSPGRWIGAGMLTLAEQPPAKHYKEFINQLLNYLPVGDSLILTVDNQGPFVMPLFELGFVPEGYTFAYQVSK